jgi:hypothetical protein
MPPGDAHKRLRALRTLMHGQTFAQATGVGGMGYGACEMGAPSVTIRLA